MDIETKCGQRLNALMDKAIEGDSDSFGAIFDIWFFVDYIQEYLSQFGLGLCGFSCRRKDGNVLLTVKVIEGGVPLVAFITGATTRSSMSVFVNALGHERVKWVKDKYPWI